MLNISEGVSVIKDTCMLLSSMIIKKHTLGEYDDFYFAPFGKQAPHPLCTQRAGGGKRNSVCPEDDETKKRVKAIG